MSTLSSHRVNTGRNASRRAANFSCALLSEELEQELSGSTSACDADSMTNQKSRLDDEDGTDRADASGAAEPVSAEEQRFLMKHLALGRKVYNHYGYGLSELTYDSFVGATWIGLVKALRKYREDGGASFSTYAWAWIRCEHEKVLEEKCSAIRIPFKSRRRVMKAELELMTKLGRRPTAPEIADELGVKLSFVEQLFNALQTPISLDAPQASSENGDFDGGYYAPADSGASPVEAAMLREEKERANERLKLLAPALETLSERDRDVFVSHSAIAKDKQTFTALARKHHISAERCRQIYLRSLKTIGAWIDEHSEVSG